MDVFKVHQDLIDDYRSFTSGFVEVRDPRIKAVRAMLSSSPVCNGPTRG